MKYSLFMLCLRLFYFSYFAIVRRTVTFCPRSALRCLPSSLFAAELITNDKVVEISPLAGFKQDNYLPGVGRSRQCSYISHSGTTTIEDRRRFVPLRYLHYFRVVKSIHSTRSELNFSSIQQNIIVYHF